MSARRAHASTLQHIGRAVISTINGLRGNHSEEVGQLESLTASIIENPR